VVNPHRLCGCEKLDAELFEFALQELAKFWGVASEAQSVPTVSVSGDTSEIRRRVTYTLAAVEPSLISPPFHESCTLSHEGSSDNSSRPRHSVNPR